MAIDLKNFIRKFIRKLAPINKLGVHTTHSLLILLLNLPILQMGKWAW